MKNVLFKSRLNFSVLRMTPISILKWFQLVQPYEHSIIINQRGFDSQISRKVGKSVSLFVFDII